MCRKLPWFSAPRWTGVAVALLSASLPLTASTNSFLKANGLVIRNHAGQGDVVPLRGVNLGSWLLMEGWMCPMDSSGLVDQYSVLQTLNNRFGVTMQESLIKTYQETWITTNDLDNIRALGMNCVRLPFWWGNMQRLDGTWRADAFEKMDWMISNAWQRGIYTIIDFHGLPGGQSMSDSTAHAGQNQFWSNPAFQTQTSMIWSNVAAHFAGNPAVAAYDLMNEPFGAPSQAAIWSAYSNLYQVVRAVDPDHIIIMEGCWSGGGLHWEWDVLPPPSQFGWTNVVYSMHAYAGTITANGEKAETDKQLNDYASHQSWNVPCFIGEFNNHGIEEAWPYSITNFNQNGMSWNNWAYKATAGSVGNSWGIYDPTGPSSSWPAKPNLQSDSITTISNKWSQWKTSTEFGITPFLKQYLGAPVAVADSYTNNGGGDLSVPAESGVLANDTDINLGQPGIVLSTILVSNPANGLLTLNADGSFTYTPDAGFIGTDTFRYRTHDGYVDSANIASVSILVTSNTTVGQPTKLIWSTQPGLATNGLPFGQQPVLMTADTSGNPSTNGLSGSLIVTVELTAGTGPLIGTTNFNMGTTGSNGVLSFIDLQINYAGTNNVLTASVLPNTPVSRLTNGNFNSPNSSAPPTGWTTWTFGGGYANHEIISPAPGVFGNYDGTYQVTLGAANTSGGGGVYQIVSATAGTSYTLSVDAGAQDWWMPTGEIRLFFLDASDTQLSLATINTTDGIHSPDKYDVGVACQNWSLTEIAPAGTTQAKVELAGFGGGSAWFDNAVLMESNSTPTLTAATTLPFTVNSPAPVSQTNYIAGITKTADELFSIEFIGTTGVTYHVQMATSLLPPVLWENVPNSIKVVTNATGAWQHVISATGAQRFFRSAVATP